MSDLTNQLPVERPPYASGDDTRNPSRGLDRENDISQLVASSASRETEPFLGDDRNSAGINYNDDDIVKSTTAQHRRAASDLGGAEQNAVISEEREGDRSANIAIYVATVIFTALTWLVVLFNYRSASDLWLAVHAPIEALSLALFTYGIATLQPTSQPKTKLAGLSRHQLAIYYVGLPIFAVGFLTIYISKSRRDKEHYTTWHGLMGIVSVVWTIAQILFGGGSVWYGGIAFGGGAKAKSVWRYHRISGYALYALLLLTSYQGGTWSSFFSKHCPTIPRIIGYVICPLVIGVALGRRARLSKMKIF